MLTILACTLSLLSPWVSSAQPKREVPRQLRIVAMIDGVDDLHLSATEARWVHLGYSMPEYVTINDREWDPREGVVWTAEEGEPFLAPDVDLAGATVTFVRGPGKVGFHHDEDGLVISFDDGLSGGASEYEVLVEFADVLCERKARVGDPDYSLLRQPSKLLIEATVDGVDELHLGPERADWSHLEWSWPKNVRIGGIEWDPQAGPLSTPPRTLFFSPTIDLGRVKMEVVKARGEVTLAASDTLLSLIFDDGAAHGADDYVVRLTFPEAPRNPKTTLPTGKAMRIELEHQPASDVAGARLTVLALSPATGEYLPWPGMRGMDRSGRCVVALPAGIYRFEVLHAASADRLVALRTAPTRLTRAGSVPLSGEARTLDWQHGGDHVELRGLAVHSILGEGEASWTRSESGVDLQLVASPKEEFSLRAFGVGEGKALAWWARRRFGKEAKLDSTKQAWVQCGFKGHGGADLPTGCEGTLHGPNSEFSFSIGPGTRLLTNRHFIGFSYRHQLEGGGDAVFHQQQLLLPKLQSRYTFELGGELEAKGSAAILYNENLGSPESKQLWWELVLVDSAGYILDSAASGIDWQAAAAMRDGSPLPAAPLSEETLQLLDDPTQTVVLTATYRWGGERSVRVDSTTPAIFENEFYRSSVPGHLTHRARAYLDKARRTYRAIESARGKPGTHTEPIELKWWLNGGAVGIWGSITMPIAGMVDDFDWYSFPWALAHESLHGFGYPHGAELNRLDREAMANFERMTWRAELDPGFVPEDW